jgi:hypothetical protein
VLSLVLISVGDITEAQLTPAASSAKQKDFDPRN